MGVTLVGSSLFLFKGDELMVKINGNDFDVSGMTISEYLATTDYDSRIIAVECNEEIIPKAKYDEVVIKDSDVIEIVSFVGGG